MDTEWKEIEGHSGYSVSNDGQVRNDETMHILSQGLVKGYYSCSPNCKSRLVHRLVAFAFLDKPTRKEDTTVNHKNGIKTDNHVSNLEWMSIRNQSHHAVSTRLRRANPVKCMDLETGDVNEFVSVAEAARTFDQAEDMIARWCQGKLTKLDRKWSYVGVTPQKPRRVPLRLPRPEGEWKPVNGAAHYEVSSSGLVWSKRYHRLLCVSYTCKSDAGIPCVNMSKYKGSTKHTVIAVHRLVALSFIGEPETKDMVVHHMDGNRKNNNVENLKWMTKSHSQSAHYGNDTAEKRAIQTEKTKEKKRKRRKERDQLKRKIRLEEQEVEEAVSGCESSSDEDDNEQQ